MDTIWDRNPSESEVIGRCGDEKNNDHKKSNVKKIQKNT